MNSDYSQRIKKVVSYIEANITKKIDLDKLAEISNFSKYHFSRIFTSLMGRTPIEFVNQKRLQKAISHLRDSAKTILEISNLCGFESISSFNSAFKKYYHKTPSGLRKELSKNPAMSRNNTEESSSPLCYHKTEKNSFLRRIWEMNITLRELPAYEIAYVRKVGSYLDTREAWEKLMTWAFQHKLFPPKHYFIGISLDDPQTVDEYSCRYEACITLPEGFIKEENPDIQFRKLPGGLYALYQFYDTVDKLGIAYQSVFGHWLPNSEYDADNRECLEFTMNNPFEDPEGKAKVDLYVPIRKRS